MRVPSLTGLARARPRPWRPGGGRSVRGQDAVIVLDELVHGGGSGVRRRARAAELLASPVVRLEVEDGPLEGRAGDPPGPRPELLDPIVGGNPREVRRIQVQARAHREQYIAAIGL